MIRVGVAGADATIELYHNWLEKCRQGIEVKPSTLATLFPPFKGFGGGGAFCDFVSDAHWSRAISPAVLDELVRLVPASLTIQLTLDRCLEVPKDLSARAPTAIVCLLSPNPLQRLAIPPG